MQKTFPLNEVIEDLLEAEKSLTSALLKLLYFGKLIKNKELIDFTNNELNGYDGRSAPTYRIEKSTVYINFQLGDTLYKYKEIPISEIEEKYRELFDKFYISNGIAAIEKLKSTILNNSNSGEIFKPVPMECLRFLQEPARRIYKGFGTIYVVEACLSISENVIVDIPNAIRTKLIDFLMSITEEFGDTIEIDTFNEKSSKNNQIIINIMNTTINTGGDGNIINTGNNNEISNYSKVYKDDLKRLEEKMKEQGIDDEDMFELAEIVKQEVPMIEKGLLGEKSNSWITKIVGKSLNGIGKIVTGISSNILATLIKEFYGM